MPRQPYSIKFPSFCQGLFCSPSGQGADGGSGRRRGESETSSRPGGPTPRPPGGRGRTEPKETGPARSRSGHGGLTTWKQCAILIMHRPGETRQAPFPEAPARKGWGLFLCPGMGVPPETAWNAARARPPCRARTGGCCIATRKLPVKETPSTTSSAGGAERPRPLFPCCHFSLSASVRGRASRPAPSLGSKRYPPPPPAFYKLLRGEREKTPPYDSGHFFAVAAHGAPSLVPLLVKGLKAEMTSSPL